VSITADSWSADTTKMSFLGMMAHYIEVKDGRWKLKADVIGFKSLSGAHGGENLGRYAVGILDRVGIMDKKGSKACAVYSSLYSITADMFHNSFTRRPWITRVITTQPARLSRISMNVGVFNGIVTKINYRMLILYSSFECSCSEVLF
jgi:hypothetical protein